MHSDVNIYTVLALFCLLAAALQPWWYGSPTPPPFYLRLNAGWLGLAVLLGWFLFGR